MPLRVLLAWLVCASLSLAQGPPRRMLVVDLDDVGYDLLAATPTPTLDGLAAIGRSFTTFYVAPVCSPTRAMLNLGAYGSHPALRLGDVVQPHGAYEAPRRPLLPLAEVVAAHGFTTAKLGKWHLAPSARPTHPNELGWQHFAGTLHNLPSFPFGYWRFEKVTNGATTVVNAYVTTDTTEDALACVRGGVDLISVSYHAPHSPWHVPPAHLHSIAPLQSDRDRARAMLQAADRELGRLLAEALPRGYTVIVFMDNGTAQALGGRKGTVFDGGVRVPCFAAGPLVAPGVEDSPCGVVDLYCTILEVFGIPGGGGPHMGPHSRSLLPLLQGQPEPRRWCYAERWTPVGSDPRFGVTPWARAVRGTRYKLVRDQSALGDRLFDIVADPAEQVDLLQAPSLLPEAAAALAHFRAVLARL